MADRTQNLVSKPPLQVAIVDQNGVLSRAWATFFRDMYQRVAYKGGNAIDGLAGDVDSLQGDVDLNLETLVDVIDQVIINANAISDNKAGLTDHEALKNPHGTGVADLVDVDESLKVPGSVLSWNDILGKWEASASNPEVKNTGFGTVEIVAASASITVDADWVKLDLPSSQIGTGDGVIYGSDSSLTINYTDSNPSERPSLMSLSYIASIQFTAGFVPTVEIGYSLNDNEPTLADAILRVDQPSANDYSTISFTLFDTISNGDKINFWIKSISGPLGVIVWHQSIGVRYDEKN